MDKLLMIGTMAWLGALMGSFAGAQVWRLRAHQLVEDKAHGETISQQELQRLRPLTRRPISKDRSRCLHCHHILAWYDLVPIVSWLSLGGRCRYCRAPIGSAEILLEVGLAVTFTVSYLFWPYGTDTSFGVISLGLWLVACVVMAVLFMYDAKWFLLPFSVNILLIAVAAVYSTYRVIALGISLELLISLAIALALMAGLYFLFSLFGWVGLGDSILGIGLALFVGKGELAFLALFVANLLGCFMLIPLAAGGKLHRHAHIPFGPFLILGTGIALLWGDALIRTVFSWTDTLLNTLMI